MANDESRESALSAVVHVYTRRQAIEDGVLVDLMQGEMGELVREAGYVVPVAMTAEAFHKYVELSPAAAEAGCDLKGRLWDILIMLRYAVRRSRGQNTLTFDFLCVTDRPKPQWCTLKAVMGPDDDGGPCLTLMLPEQD